MFGFGKAKTLEGPLSLQDARFSAEDLFGLIGGYDNYALTMGTQIAEVDDEDVADVVPHWRRNALTRLIGTGLLDEDGEPAQELSRALAPLSAPGLIIANDAEPASSGAAAVYMYEDTWTMVRKARGFRSGWSLQALDPERGAGAAVAELLGSPEVGVSEWEGSGFITAGEREKIIDAVNNGKQDVLADLAESRSIPRGALYDLANSYGRGFKNPKAFGLQVRDYRGCTMGEEAGYKTPIPVAGIMRSGAVTTIPSKGFFMRLAAAPTASDTPESYTQAEEKNGRTFCQAVFVHEGDVLEAAVTLPAHYPTDAISAY